MNNAFWRNPLHYCTIGQESAEVKRTSQKNMKKSSIKFCQYCASPLERLYSIEAAAEYLSCGKHTIRNWIRDREIDYVKIKGLIRIRKSAIEKECQTFPKMSTIVNKLMTDNS